MKKTVLNYPMQHIPPQKVLEEIFSRENFFEVVFLEKTRKSSRAENFRKIKKRVFEKVKKREKVVIWGSQDIEARLNKLGHNNGQTWAQ